MPLLSDAPPPRRVMSSDGAAIATYEWGDPDAPTVVAIHGFASSAIANWHITGWTRDLTRAGLHVVALDQRGHGASAKPHHPADYSMNRLVADLVDVIDTYLLDEFALLGYSLGARVGWHAALDLPSRVTRTVLGGIRDSDPLAMTYLDMASRMPGNDLAALVSLVEGMGGGAQPDPLNPPQQPTLFATGSHDPIVEASRRLSAFTPRGEFFEIPNRNHFNAPTSNAFRERGTEFLRR